MRELLFGFRVFRQTGVDPHYGGECYVYIYTYIYMIIYLSLSLCIVQFNILNAVWHGVYHAKCIVYRCIPTYSTFAG